MSAIALRAVIGSTWSRRNRARAFWRIIIWKSNPPPPSDCAQPVSPPSISSTAARACRFRRPSRGATATIRAGNCARSISPATFPIICRCPNSCKTVPVWAASTAWSVAATAITRRSFSGVIISRSCATSSSKPRAQDTTCPRIRGKQA